MFGSAVHVEAIKPISNPEQPCNPIHGMRQRKQMEMVALSAFDIPHPALAVFELEQIGC
jgi:hypothetical protein